MSDELKEPAPKEPGGMPIQNHHSLCPLHDEQWPRHPLEKCHYCELIAAAQNQMLAKHEGQSLLLASECEKRVTESRENVIRDCIAVIEYLHDHEAPHDAHKDALWNAITALRALQEKP